MPFYTENPIFLPRQARDKQRGKHSNKEMRFRIAGDGLQALRDVYALDWEHQDGVQPCDDGLSDAPVDSRCAIYIILHTLMHTQSQLIIVYLDV